MATLLTLTFAACGSSNTSTQLPASSSSPQPSISLSPTPKGNILALTQINIALTISPGLTQVTYQAHAAQTQTDGSGTSYTSQEFDLTTPEYASAVQTNPGLCQPPYTEAVLLVLSADPATLTGQGFGGPANGKVGSRWFLLQPLDGGPCNSSSGSVLTTQLPLLRQMAASATAD